MTTFSLQASIGAPGTVVRDFFVRYAAGDMNGASRLWVSGAPAEDFARRHSARLEKRCLRIESLTIDAVSEDPPVFDAAFTITLRTTAPGSPEWWESSRSRVALQRDGGEWRIASWEPRERELIDRLLVSAAAGPQAVLDASEELQTTTFVRLAAQQGVDLVNKRQMDKAETLTSAALAAAERLGDPVSMSTSLSAKSVVLRTLLRLDASLGVAEEAVALADGTGDPDVLARALVRLARTRQLHDGLPSQEATERALALSPELEDVAIAAHAAVHLGRSYEFRGAYSEAFRHAELASSLAEESGDPAAMYAASIFLNGAYLWIDDKNLAERHGLRALEIAREAHFDLDTAARIGDGAAVTAYGSGFAKALGMVDAALGQTNDPRSAAILSIKRATVNILMSNLGEAERDLDRAAAVAYTDPMQKQAMQFDRAKIAFQRGRDDDALRHVEESLAPIAVIARGARHLRARILVRNGRLEEARHLAESLIAEGDAAGAIDPQRLLFHGLQHPTHRLLVELLVEQGDSAAAFDIVEELKGNELSAVVTHGKNAEVMTPEEQARERSIEERMHELNRRLLGGRLPAGETADVRKQIGDARADLVDFRQRVYAMRLAGRNREAGGICIDELPAYLDDVTMVSYVIGPEQTMIFVLEPKRNGRRELLVRPIAVDDTQLTDRVARLAALVGQRNLRAPDAAEEMYDLLIRPIEPSVRTARSLCIIPDGPLWHVPFQALGAAGGPLLVERVPLFYTPSVTLLAAAGSKREERRPARKPRLLAFANPTVDATTASLYRAFDPDAPLGAIPETESEVRAIARIYGPDASRVYVGKTARETTLKEEASRFDVLHIATHGVVYDNSPMFSSILLAASPSDEKDDGVLEAREIAALALDADLTVLSACETGRAGVLTSSGVIGLAWAFLAAGSQTTVVSQWKAHSAATETLMVEFHRQLAAGQSKPEALRRAQLALRRDRRYRHPFYWAPFAVIGVP